MKCKTIYYKKNAKLKMQNYLLQKNPKKTKKQTNTSIYNNMFKREYYRLKIAV